MKAFISFFVFMMLLGADPFGAVSFLLDGILWALNGPESPVFAGLIEAIPLTVSLARKIANGVFSNQLTMELPALAAPLSDFA